MTSDSFGSTSRPFRIHREVWSHHHSHHPKRFGTDKSTIHWGYVQTTLTWFVWNLGYLIKITTHRIRNIFRDIQIPHNCGLQIEQLLYIYILYYWLYTNDCISPYNVLICWLIPTCNLGAPLFLKNLSPCWADGHGHWRRWCHTLLQVQSQ